MNSLPIRHLVSLDHQVSYVTRQFDQIAASLYVQEIHELIDACLFQLEELKKSQDEWLRLVEEVEHRLGSHLSPDDSVRFNEALWGQAKVQTEVFDRVEAFLAAWARLSLLFGPAPRRSSPNRAFTEERGQKLRDLYEIDESNPVMGRELRDSWMHADERLDDAWIRRHLGNRQQFVTTREVERAVRQSPRVIDVQGLTVHYRDAQGTSCSQNLLALRPVLEDLLARERAAHVRIRGLPIEDR